ncbi:MAG: DnaD domain protein [Anaerolineaceae bacterium]
MNTALPTGGFGGDPATAWFLPADLLERAAEMSLTADGLLAVLAFFRLLGKPEEGSQAVKRETLAEALNLTLFRQDAARTQSALEGALAAGFLLCNEDLLLPGTPCGKDLLVRLQAGNITPEQLNVVSQLPAPQRPNIFRLYEANIGPLTPMMAEMLKADALEYPADWIEDAISEAVERNIRNWRYVRAILKTWKEKGRADKPKETEGYLEKYRKLYEDQRRRKKHE